MNKQTGTLLFAYQTIADMEVKIIAQADRIKELEEDKRKLLIARNEKGELNSKLRDAAQKIKHSALMCTPSRAMCDAIQEACEL